MDSNRVNRSIYVLFVCGLLLASWNCTTTNSSDQPSNGDTPVVANEGTGGVVIAEPAAAGGEPVVQQTVREPACPMNNLTQQCTCVTETGTAEGKQVCNTVRGWGPCECSEIPSTIVSRVDDTPVPDPVVNKGPEHFDWQRTMPTGGECLPGHYKGEFAGQYSPALTMTFGIFDITGTVEFDLFDKGNGEFLEIENGVMEGIAIESVPFTGEIVGTLDCATGWAEAYLVNCMYVVAVVLPALFEGPAYGIYDKINHVFVDGVWSVTEEDLDGNYPPPLPVHPGDPLPQIGILTITGGVGTWSATFVQ